MNSRRIFWTVWAIALLPVGAALLVWVSGVGVPERSLNRGELVQPVRTLAQWGGSPERFRGHWSLLLVPQAPCHDACDAQLEALRRVHDALGRDADRVRVLAARSVRLAPGVWVVDPLGNLVLRHALPHDGAALLADLRRLLKASRLG